MKFTTSVFFYNITSCNMTTSINNSSNSCLPCGLPSPLFRQLPRTKRIKRNRCLAPSRPKLRPRENSWLPLLASSRLLLNLKGLVLLQTPPTISPSIRSNLQSSPLPFLSNILTINSIKYPSLLILSTSIVIQWKWFKLPLYSNKCVQQILLTLYLQRDPRVCDHNKVKSHDLEYLFITIIFFFSKTIIFYF